MAEPEQRLEGAAMGGLFGGLVGAGSGAVAGRHHRAQAADHLQDLNTLSLEQDLARSAYKKVMPGDHKGHQGLADDQFLQLQALMHSHSDAQQRDAALGGVGSLLGGSLSGVAGAHYADRQAQEAASKIASSPALTSIVRLFRKEADLRTSLMRALGGAAVGGAVGGGGGALMAHLQGGDVAANARKGAIGGAGLGMMGGALSGFAPRGTLAGMPADALTKGTGAALTGLGGAFGAHLMSPISGGGGAAAEQAQRELGKFNGQQAIKQQQSVSLAPQQDAAFRQAQQDEVIQQADPALVASSFATMKRFAPNLAADPNAVRSFLRESATWNSGPSYATLKNLADAERAVAGAGGAGSPF